MWPQEYIELKNIEGLLVCGICYEYMKTSVITSCSHNYCSLCIRKYLHYKTQCPICFSETFEKDLRKNNVVDEIIEQFSRIKDKLKRCLQIQVQFMQNEKGDITLDNSISLDQSREVPLDKQEAKIINTSLISTNNASPSTNKSIQQLQKDVSSPSTSGKSTIPLMFTPKSIKRPNVTNTEDTKVVICPVCKVTISEININRHLDDCLKREAIKEQPQKVDQKRKPLPKLVFSLMKDLVIRKKLKEFGLSSHGDRKAMETRLQRYIVLYNAECDKLNPRSVLELLKQCEDEENFEKKVNKTSTFTNRLQVNRNTEENIIDNERKKYLETHKDSFESLIKKIKRVKSPKKSSARRSLLNESIESNEDTPHKFQAVDTENSDESINETEKNDCQSTNYNVLIQDSDSDSSCPLQMYSSTEPKKFLNIELPSNKNTMLNKSGTNYEGSASQKDFRSNCVHIKTEDDDSNIDVVNDVSISNKETHSMESTHFRDTPKNDSRNVCNTSKYKNLLQRKIRISTNDEMNRMDCVPTGIGDSDCSEIDIEDVKPIPILHDVLCDLSSNDSIESKINSGRSRSTEHGFLNNSVLNSSNLEKENISSSPECSGYRSLRKRSRDAIQNDAKIMLSTRARIQKSPKYSETEETNEESVSSLNNNDDRRLQKKPRLRKRVSNTSVVEDSTTVRKSVRRKVKNNIS